MLSYASILLSMLTSLPGTFYCYSFLCTSFELCICFYYAPYPVLQFICSGLSFLPDYELLQCQDCELFIFVAQSSYSAWYLKGTQYVFVGWMSGWVDDGWAETYSLGNQWLKCPCNRPPEKTTDGLFLNEERTELWPRPPKLSKPGMGTFGMTWRPPTELTSRFL